MAIKLNKQPYKIPKSDIHKSVPNVGWTTIKGPFKYCCKDDVVTFSCAAYGTPPLASVGKHNSVIGTIPHNYLPGLQQTQIPLISTSTMEVLGVVIIRENGEVLLQHQKSTSYYGFIVSWKSHLA